MYGEFTWLEYHWKKTKRMKHAGNLPLLVITAARNLVFHWLVGLEAAIAGGCFTISADVSTEGSNTPQAEMTSTRSRRLKARSMRRGYLRRDMPSNLDWILPLVDYESHVSGRANRSHVNISSRPSTRTRVIQQYNKPFLESWMKVADSSVLHLDR